MGQDLTKLPASADANGGVGAAIIDLAAWKQAAEQRTAALQPPDFFSVMRKFAAAFYAHMDSQPNCALRRRQPRRKPQRPAD